LEVAGKERVTGAALQWSIGDVKGTNVLPLLPVLLGSAPAIHWQIACTQSWRFCETWADSCVRELLRCLPLLCDRL